MRSRDKRRSKGGKFVRLDEWFQAQPAWATLKPGPRALYMELKRRYNGGNNGRIPMAAREAAVLLNVHRNTVSGYFEDLEERRLIRATKRGHLGEGGHGIASLWLLCELPSHDGKPPDLGFQKWKPGEKPVTKTGRPCHDNCAPGRDFHSETRGPSQ